MLLLREGQARGAVSFELWGDAPDLQRLADHLATVGNTQLATLVRDASRTPKLVAGRPRGAVCFHLGQSGVPHALMEAAQGAGVELERVSAEVGPDASTGPVG